MYTDSHHHLRSAAAATNPTKYTFRQIPPALARSPPPRSSQSAVHCNGHCIVTPSQVDSELPRASDFIPEYQVVDLSLSYPRKSGYSGSFAYLRGDGPAAA